MSKTRIVIRLFLVLVLAGVLWAVYRNWVRSQPEFYWNRAQAAAAAGNRPAAMLYLQNLLKQFPEHSAGHVELARLLLDEARASKRPAEYATHPEALHHLAQAARLRPHELALQKPLLEAYMRQRLRLEAAEVAERIVKQEPDHPDALFALAWRAVETKEVGRAAELLANLESHPSRYMFQTIALTVQNAGGSKDPDAVQKSCAAAVDAAARLDRQMISTLSSDDLEMMPRLLLAAVQQAPDNPTAETRLRQSLTGLETLAQLRPRHLAQVAETASQMLLVLEAKYPRAEQSPQIPTVRDQLASRVESLRQQAMPAGKLPPLVYHQSAVAAVIRGDDEAALATLRQGLAAGAKLPAARQAELLDLHMLAARVLIKQRRFAEADEHLKVLVAHEKSAGWGCLLAGAVAAYEGKLERSLELYTQAQKRLGNTFPVRLALANTHMALGQWAMALPHLAALHRPAESLTPEEREWAKQQLPTDLQVHFSEYRAYLALGQRDKAQPHLKALRGSELEPQALALEVSSLLAAEKATEAQSILADARKQFPRSRVLLQVEVAMLEQTGQQEDAGKAVKAFAAMAPDDLTSQLLWCDWQIRHQQSDQALKQLEALEARLAKSPQDKGVLTALKAQALLTQGKPEEALALIERLRADPKMATLANLLGATVQWQRADLDSAAQALLAVSQAEPENSTVALLQGEIEAARGDYGVAVAHLAKALDVTSVKQRAGTTLLKSLVLLAKKSPTEAEAKVDQLLRAHPDDPVLLIAKADLQFQQNRFEAGLQSLDRLERVEPQGAAAPHLKAVAWFRVGEVQRALAEVHRALERDPKHLASLELAAQAHLVAQKNDEALEFAELTLAQAPRLVSATLAKAEALRRMNRSAEALLVLQQAIRQHPDVAEAYLGLAELHMVVGESDKALAVLRAGRKQRPEHLPLLGTEVRQLASSGHLADARKLADESAGAKPDFLRCQTLGQAFAAAKQSELARDWFQRALAAAEGTQKPAAHYLLGNLMLGETQQRPNPRLLAEAREHFAAVVEAEPTNLLAANNLAWMLANDFNDPAQAMRVAEAARGAIAVEKLPADFLHTLVVVYRRAGQAEKARRVLEEALTHHAKHARLIYQLAMVYADAEQWDLARQALNKALGLGLPDDESADAKKRLSSLPVPGQQAP